MNIRGSAGRHWTDIIIRQKAISELSYNDNVHHSRLPLASYDYYSVVKSQQTVSELTLETKWLLGC
jgi:hypothetical protein